MPKKLDESVAQKIMQGIIDGKKSEDLEKMYSVSRRTVARLKKRVDTMQMTTAEKSFIQNHDISLPSSLQGKMNTADYYRKSLEDAEEGWYAHALQGSVLYSGTSMYFVGIVYGDSPEEITDLMHKAEAKGLSFGYIIHDHDYWMHDSPEVKDGDTLVFAEGERYRRLDPKKLHAHVMVKYESARAWNVNQRIVGEIFGLNTIAWQIAENPQGMWEYFLHRTPSAQQAGKYQYPESSRICVNNFVVQPTKWQRDLMATEINHYIHTQMYAEFGRYEYSDLTRKYDKQTVMLSIIRGNSNSFGDTITSLRHINGTDFSKMSDEALQRTEEDLRRKLKQCEAEVEKRSLRSK